ncbi:MAG: hypothetical protein ACI8XB_000075 [Patiriisocius sp.]|jgi:hypothetical protein
MKFKISQLQTIAGFFLLNLMVTSCANEGNSKMDTPITKIEANAKDSGAASLISLDGNLFSVSSPLESIVQLKKSATSFNEDVLIGDTDISMLTSNFDKAIHLGMIGADMGYASIHNQQMKSIQQFMTLRSLSQSLNLANAVDESLIQRLASNTNNVDSLMILVSEFYREADQYLQENDRMDIASWVIVGGWVESMHFSLDVIRGGNEDLKQQIAGQKNSYKNLLKMVTKFSNNDQSNKLVKQLAQIEQIFDEVIYTYNYQQPEVNIDSKTTILKGTTDYEFTDETLLKLSTSITSLRESFLKQ